MRALHLQTLRRAPQVVCLNFEVLGLEQLRAQHDRAVVDMVLAEIGTGLAHSVRATDLVCRYHSWQFVVALLDCPEQFSARVAERAATRLIRQTLERVNRLYGTTLQLRWKAAPLPRRRLSLPDLLRTVEQAFNPPALALAPAYAPVEV